MRRLATSRATLTKLPGSWRAHVGGWLEDSAVFVETLTGVSDYDAEKNQEYFGTSERPGQIYQTAQHAIDVWASVGMLKMTLSPSDIIAHGIWDD